MKKRNEKIILLRDTSSFLMSVTSPIKTKHTAGCKIHPNFRGVQGWGKKVKPPGVRHGWSKLPSAKSLCCVRHCPRGLH